MHKSFKDLSLNITEEEYRNDGCLHYSMLSDYAKRGFDCIDKLTEKKESPSLLFGSAVDTLLTEGRQQYNSKYFIADLPSLTDSLYPIANQLFELYHSEYDSLDKISDEDIARIGKENSFYANDKYKNYRIKLIKEGCSEYYKMKFLAGEKQIISSEFNDSVEKTVHTLLTAPNTKWYFQQDTPFEDIERLYQLKFKAVFFGVPYSCMADLIIVNHEEKTIQPVDLKTSGHKEYDFYKSFIDWNYHIQARLYYKIIEDNVRKDEFFKEYKIMPYKFIVINKESLLPLVWEYEDTTAEGTLIYGKHEHIECKSPLELGSELWHYLNNKCDVPLGININNENKLTKWLRQM